MLGMSSSWDFFSFFIAFLLFLSPVTAQLAKPSSWQTLSGSAPLVIAKGGFSGIFPDSSAPAYQFALQISTDDAILWCDVQLTKDGVGICLPEIKLDNCTGIADLYPQGKKKYSINGNPTEGWFSVDYNASDLANVGLVQAIYSRTPIFNFNFGIFLVEDVAALKPPGLWLNIQHDIFYSQHHLNMRTYVLSVSKQVIVSYVSSPEVNFLRGLVTRFSGTKTKLVFRFLGRAEIEPSMNQAYDSLLKNLTFIKTFASGILVPKEYIWPVTNDLYLLPYTFVVTDAHKAGLEVFASGFQNDAIIPFNFTYDPLAEYLKYVDNGVFSVDGVLTDHPLTSSEAIGCYSHIDKNNNSSDLGKPIIISHNGASGAYPDCTDLAYKQAVEDGADFIDCPVQMTQDRVLICMSSIDLIPVTTVATSAFRARLSILPEIQTTYGSFTFNFTWDEIQKNLIPVISSPEAIYFMVRNPRFKHSGKFMILSDFLAFAKDKAISGVTIKIDNAAFLVESLGFDVVDEVIGALNNAGYNDHATQQVMIQSNSSSVLIKFKQQTKYKLSYMVHESISNADNSSIASIANFAHSVAINKKSIFPKNYNFIIGQTEVVKSLHSAGLAVYVHVLRNEFVTHAWDYFMDPYVEINSFVKTAGVDGIITDSPGTTKLYRRNTCANLSVLPQYMETVDVGGLLSIISTGALPPAIAPSPVLDAADVVESPLPSAPPVPGAKAGPPTSAPAPSGSCVHLSSFALIFLSQTMIKLML